MPSFRRALRACFALIALLFPLAALADPAVDAALDASDVVDQHCVDLQADNQLQTDKVIAVAQVLGKVDAAFQQTQADYLLFWRGVLNQCLNAKDPAIAAFEQFIATQGDSGTYADLVAQARTRLKRLGGTGELTEGWGANWIRSRRRFDLRAAYGAGVGLGLLTCTDREQMVYTSSCESADSWDVATLPAVAPLLLDLDARLWLHRTVGVALRVGLDLALAHNGHAQNAAFDWYSIDPQGDNGKPRSPGPTLQADLGPALRFTNTSSDGRTARSAVILPRLSVAWSEVAPLAGYRNLQQADTLDAGTLHVVSIGGAVEIAVDTEIDDQAIFSLIGRAGLYAPSRGGLVTAGAAPATRSVIGPDSATTPRDEGLPDDVDTTPQQAGRMTADLRFAPLRIVRKNGVAVGPVVYAGWRMHTLRYPEVSFPDGTDDFCEADPFCWRIDDAGGQISDVLRQRRLHSTRRQEVLLGAGIEVRFGGGAVRTTADADQPAEGEGAEGEGTEGEGEAPGGGDSSGPGQ